MGYKKKQKKKKQKEKLRKARIKSPCAENHRLILLREATFFCLTTVFLQTAVTDETLPKLLKKELEKRL